MVYCSWTVHSVNLPDNAETATELVQLSLPGHTHPPAPPEHAFHLAPPPPCTPPELSIWSPWDTCCKKVCNKTLLFIPALSARFHCKENVAWSVSLFLLLRRGTNLPEKYGTAHQSRNLVHRSSVTMPEKRWINCPCGVVFDFFFEPEMQCTTLRKIVISMWNVFWSDLHTRDHSCVKHLR